MAGREVTRCGQGWTTLRVRECVRSDLQRKGSVLRAAYQETGRFPIVDQGAGPIAGYSNDESLVYQDDLPLIVFGDHTRAIKFLDLPFITGADGTRVLKPNAGILDPMFFSYALRGLRIPSRGYNRHFQLLMESEIHVPLDLQVQRRIAQTLRSLERLRSLAEAESETLARLKAAALAKLFREGLRREPLKETEIGPVPQSWRVMLLSSCCDVRAGGTPSRLEPSYWGGEIPWVKTGEIDYNTILGSAESITPAGLANSSAKIFPAGTLLMAMYGQGVTRGRVAILGVPAATNQACAGFFPGAGLAAGFLYAYFANSYERLRNLGHGANQRNLSADVLRSMLVPVPTDFSEQLEIAAVFASLLKASELAARRVHTTAALFEAILSRLMSGELRLPEEAAQGAHA